VAIDPYDLALRYIKMADLNPSLGHPGGSCYFQRRIRDRVRNKKVQDYLIDKHQTGPKVDWKDMEEDAIYGKDMDIGPVGQTLAEVILVPHTQRRMDIRSITIPEIKKGLHEFMSEIHDEKRKGDSRLEKQLISRKDFEWEGSKIKFWLRGLNHWMGKNKKGKPQLKVKLQVRTAMPVPFKHPNPVPEPNCPHFKKEDWEGYAKEYPAHGFERMFPKRVALRYAVLRQDPIPGVQTYVTQRSEEGLPNDVGDGSPSATSLPGSATPGGAGRVIPQFSFNTPGPDSDITPRTLGIPGEQYGNPSNDTYNTVDRRIIESSLDDEDESMDKQAYRPKWRPGKYQRKSRGRTKHKRQMNYRKNKAKNKLKAKRWRKINSRKPAYKQWQKRRRGMNRKRRVASPQRVLVAYMGRRGSVLTVPDIAFQIGPEMIGGYVHSISPMSGMVTVELDSTNVSQLDSIPVELFMRMVVFSSDEDIEAFFNLVDVEVGPEAYGDLDPNMVRRCARRYDRDPDSDSFKEDCFGIAGEYDLGSMDADQMDSVVQMVAQGYMQSGDSRDFTMAIDHDERSGEDADNPDIPDGYDPHLYYGEVERG
jgi:hypothetical protein